jgi:tRNA pseudouridine55 synthase
VPVLKMDIIISLNKPKDITSQDAVTKVKKILKVKKAGHTGTLDPMATGLMLVCVGKSTRLASYFTGLDKEYKAVMKLGETTDTQDACGKVIEKVENVDVDEELIKDVLQSFTGPILQTPPMFSALKHKGTPLYKLARKGVEIERKSREVTIYKIELTDINLPHVTFVVRCSKGTYIRTLCDDVGRKLGTGAHLSALERTAVGEYNINDALTLDELRAVSEGEDIKKGIYTMDEALSWLPEFRVKDTSVKNIMNGNPIKLNTAMLPDEIMKAGGIRIKSPGGDLLAIGSYVDVINSIKMDVVFV